ncbi:MAG: hypothetical protein GW898_09270 [Thiomicrospira sp.]|nr:hypothetical protein [Thiomicrospira sp.]NCN66593.1 hypothetical protein [Thiomicrospira sp.]NCO14546.1 hypothetical protein [Thiomicrospira sp.]NCO82470.1 hypothetical protein [Thiomicrospira sp.]
MSRSMIRFLSKQRSYQEICKALSGATQTVKTPRSNEMQMVASAIKASR